MNRLEIFINSLEDDGHTIVRLKHAYRVNGGLDIYRRAYTLFVKKNNSYLKYKTEDEMFESVKNILAEIPKVNSFNQVKNGMAYREFKMEMYAMKDSSHAEDFHWRINENVSEDHMYFIFHRDTVKIGRTKDINKRIKSLKTSLSHDYSVFLFKNKGHMEKVMHNLFSSFRTSREWFKSDYRMSRFAKKYGEIFNTKKIP